MHRESECEAVAHTIRGQVVSKGPMMPAYTLNTTSSPVSPNSEPDWRASGSQMPYDACLRISLCPPDPCADSNVPGVCFNPLTPKPETRNPKLVCHLDPCANPHVSCGILWVRVRVRVCLSVCVCVCVRAITVCMCVCLRVSLCVYRSRSLACSSVTAAPLDFCILALYIHMMFR